MSASDWDASTPATEDGPDRRRRGSVLDLLISHLPLTSIPSHLILQDLLVFSMCLNLHGRGLKTWHPQFVWPESVMSTDFLYAGTFNVHWLSLLYTYTCARRFGYPQDTNGILRMPRYPQDASGVLRIRYPQDTAVSSGYRVLRIYNLGSGISSAQSARL